MEGLLPYFTYIHTNTYIIPANHMTRLKCIFYLLSLLFDIVLLVPCELKKVALKGH